MFKIPSYPKMYLQRAEHNRNDNEEANFLRSHSRDGVTVHGEVFRGAVEPLADKSHLETNFSVLPARNCDNKSRAERKNRIRFTIPSRLD